MSYVEKWEKTKILDGIADEFKENVANCLESQIVFNETTSATPRFALLSIPIIRRAIATSKTLQRNTFISEEESVGDPIFHVFKSEFKNVPEGGLKEEAAFVAEFSEEIRNEFDQLFADTVKKKIHFSGLECIEDRVYLWYTMG